MKAIIHIGHHKTGTTSLQAFLAVNWVKLLSNGILTPWVESEGAAWTQAQLLHPEPAIPELLSAKVREPHNAMAFRMLATVLQNAGVPGHHRGVPMPPVLMRAIENQIDALDPEVVVFCSEVMSRFGPEAPELIDMLSDPLSGAETGLHVTLRRPDDHLASWFGQQLWFGDPRPPLSDPENDLFRGVHFDYRAVVEPWLDRMPGIEPRLRAQHDMMQAGGSIDDFFAQWGIDLPDEVIGVPAMNPSVPRALFPLMRAANTALPRPVARTLGPELLHIADELDLVGNGEIEFFGAERRSEMAERFAPINNWLTEINGTPLFGDIDSLAETRPVSEAEALDRVLTSLSDEHIADLSNPELRAFLSGLKAQH